MREIDIARKIFTDSVDSEEICFFAKASAAAWMLVLILTAIFGVALPAYGIASGITMFTVALYFVDRSILKQSRKTNGRAT